MEFNKNEILKICLSTKNSCFIRESYFKNKFPDAYSDILKINFPETFVFKQKLYHWIYDDFNLNLGICPECGKRCKFKSITSGYHKYCCYSCATSSKEIQNKIKKTCLKKYNVEYSFQSENNKQKSKETFLKKYGTDNAMKCESVQKKSQETLLLHFGKPFTFQCEEIKQKSEETCLKRYGVRHPSQNKNIYDKVKKTNNKKYGCDNPAKNKDIKDKTRNTNLSIYGVACPGVLGSPISKKEKEFQKYICNIYSGEILKNNSKILHGKEIDVYLPDLKIGFEFNGDYWHMNPNIYSKDHYNKTLKCYANDVWKYDEQKIKYAKSIGITLYVIWEYDWTYNNEKTKKDILNIIKNSTSQ